MRLLHVNTRELREFLGNDVPEYAILSHRWGDQEISFAEMSKPVSGTSSKTGYKKIKACCDMAFNWSIEWVWIDTCCIDKTSSAELSEAINSMFGWYARSQVCFAYLEDIVVGTLREDANKDTSVSKHTSLGDSEWFYRGWTLQELLAPTQLVLFDRDWAVIGAKSDLWLELHQITGISEDVLALRKPVHDATIAQRMSWAGLRSTTRPEDIAYCLLGLFDVNMPLLYGEGPQKAFLRLQEEILKYSSDHTIFAWTMERMSIDDDFYKVNSMVSGLLAPHPRCFLRATRFEPFTGLDAESLLVSSTNIGLSLRMHVYKDESGQLWGTLNCCESADENQFAYINLYAIDKNNSQYCRTDTQVLSRGVPRGKARQIYVRHKPFIAANNQPKTHWIRVLKREWPSEKAGIIDFTEDLRSAGHLKERNDFVMRMLKAGTARNIREDSLWGCQFPLPLMPGGNCLAIWFKSPVYTNYRPFLRFIIGRTETGSIGVELLQDHVRGEDGDERQDNLEILLRPAPIIYRIYNAWFFAVQIKTQAADEADNNLADSAGSDKVTEVSLSLVYNRDQASVCEKLEISRGLTPTQPRFSKSWQDIVTRKAPSRA